MITTKNVLQWLKGLFDSPSWTVGKLDTTKDRTVCLYGGREVQPSREVLGGGAKGYDTKSLQLVVRWSENASDAEAKALEVYEKLNLASGQVAGRQVWAFLKDEEPVSMGTDDLGVYEYSLRFNLICER